MVLVALLLIGLVGIMALVLDGGNLYLRRRQLQNASDATALATAYKVAGAASDASINSTLIEYAITRNGAGAASAVYLPSNAQVGSGYMPSGSTAVRVTVTQTVSTFFAGMIGLRTSNISASATAQLEQTSSGCGKYAIWGQSQSCLQGVDWDWTGSGGVVHGDTHSNAGVKIAGSHHTITGKCEYVTTYQQTGSGHSIAPVQVQAVADYPVTFNIADYRQGGRAALAAAAVGKYYVHNGNWSVSGSDETIPEGLHYVTGNASISGSGHYGHITVVAEGQADMSGSGCTYEQYIDGLLIFSNYERTGNPKCTSAVSNVSGSGGMFRGIVYAPKGLISYSGSGQHVMKGGLIGWVVDVSGSDFSVTYDDTICSSQPTSIVVHLTR
jgi:hypothetical protein